MRRTHRWYCLLTLVLAGCAAPAPSATGPSGAAPPALTPVPTSAPAEGTPAASGISEAEAIAAAAPYAAQQFAGPATFLRASEEKEQCVPDTCGRAWFVTFSGADSHGRSMRAVVVIDPATGEYLYADVSMVP